MRQIKVIRNEIEYSELCKELDELMAKNPKKNSPEWKKMQELINSISEYEESLYNTGGK